MSGLVHRTRQNRAFFIKDVDMRLSFDGIQRVAQEMVGAEVILGDIVVCDSPTKRKRKMLQRTATGYMIYYGRLDIKGQEFEPLADHSGQVKRINREIL